DTYINAQSVCDLLYKLAALGLTIPITLVLDNARYQKCALVVELAQSLNIELLYLTTYSPNLNLIERLMKNHWLTLLLFAYLQLQPEIFLCTL
ncbi:MAG: hypothetical protein RLZZ139_2099, partial [Cyanobacteriota bacterium]